MGGRSGSVHCAYSSARASLDLDLLLLLLLLLLLVLLLVLLILLLLLRHCLLLLCRCLLFLHLFLLPFFPLFPLLPLLSLLPPEANSTPCPGRNVGETERTAHALFQDHTSTSTNCLARHKLAML